MAARYQELNADYYVAFVTVLRGDTGWAVEEEDLFMMPKGYDPELDGGHLGADLIRSHYMREEKR